MYKIKVDFGIPIVHFHFLQENEARIWVKETWTKLFETYLTPHNLTYKTYHGSKPSLSNRTSHIYGIYVDYLRNGENSYKNETNKTTEKNILVVLLQKDQALFEQGLDESQRRFQPQVKLEAKASKKAGFPIQTAPLPDILHLLSYLHLLVPLEQMPTMKLMNTEQLKQKIKVLLLYPPLQPIASSQLLKTEEWN